MKSAGAEIDSQLEQQLTPPVRVPDSFPASYRSAVVALADEMRISVDQVHKLYGIVLARLSKEATIRDYLPILVTKKVRNLMQNKLKIHDKTKRSGKRGLDSDTEIR